MTRRQARTSHRDGRWRRVGLRAVAALAAAALALALAWALAPRLRLSVAPLENASLPAPSGGHLHDDPSPAPQPLDDVVRALGASPAERAALLEFYGGPEVEPQWLSDAALTADGGELRDLLRGAGRHGLEPADYLVGPLATAGALPAAPGSRAGYDAALTLGALRYMRDLHLGRVDPRALGLDLDPWREPHAFPVMLRDALAAHRVATVVHSLAPPFALYAQLLD
ncbi:MAG: hypothetical protein ABI880_14655, partial [Acidobacteriota bacterium]